MESKVRLMEAVAFPYTLPEWQERAAMYASELSVVSWLRVCVCVSSPHFTCCDVAHVQDLDEDWRVRVVAELHDKLQEKFNFYQRDLELYKASPLRTLMVSAVTVRVLCPSDHVSRVPQQMTMHQFLGSQLQSVVVHSIDDFLVFLCQKCTHTAMAAFVSAAVLSLRSNAGQSKPYGAVNDLFQWVHQLRATGQLPAAFADADTAGARASKPMFKMSLSPGNMKVTFSPTALEVSTHLCFIHSAYYASCVSFQLEATLVKAVDSIVEAARGVFTPEHNLLAVMQLAPEPLLPMSLPEGLTTRPFTCEEIEAASVIPLCAPSNIRWAMAKYVTMFCHPLPSRHLFVVNCRVVIPALVAVEMTTPHTIAMRYSRFVWVLSESPKSLRASLVLHKWHSVFAGWGSEPADTDKLDVLLGVSLPDDAPADAVPKRKLFDEVAEVRKYHRAVKEIDTVSPNSIDAGLIELDSTHIKSKLAAAAQELMNTMLDIIAADCGRVIQLAIMRYKALQLRADQKPTVRFPLTLASIHSSQICAFARV